MFEAVASTPAYDHIALLGEEAAVPIERAAHVAVPTLVMDDGASYPFMHVTAMALAHTMPHAQHIARWKIKPTRSLPRRLLPCWWSSSHPMRVEPRPSALASCGPATSATASPVIFAALYARCRPPAGRVALHLCDARDRLVSKPNAG
jgi:hypothetical protein